MRVILGIVTTLLLAFLGSARAQYTNGTSPYNVSIAFYCNTTYCNQTSTSVAAGGADPGTNNKIWAPLYTCLAFKHPELNCTDHTDTESKYKSFWVTSCSNNTLNDTVTISVRTTAK